LYLPKNLSAEVGYVVAFLSLSCLDTTKLT